jgi:hypothetical protein
VAAGSVGEWEIHELARRRATRMGASLISVYSMSLTRLIYPVTHSVRPLALHLCLSPCLVIPNESCEKYVSFVTL